MSTSIKYISQFPIDSAFKARCLNWNNIDIWVDGTLPGNYIILFIVFIDDWTREGQADGFLTDRSKQYFTFFVCFEN